MRASADDEAAWSSAGTLNPELSYDEEFCIIDKGCGHVLRQLTASPEDVERLDALLREVSFDANVDEWLALLKSSDDSDGDADGDAAPGGVTGATGVFDEDGDLVGFVSTVVYGGHTDAPFGWVGNIVVRSDYRKRGVASMVLRAALDSMGASTLAVLDASAMGAPLYLKAGFAPVAAVRRWTLSREDALGTAKNSKRASTNAAGDVAAAVAAADATADWSGGDGALITDMDAAVFGAPRGNTLRAWRDTVPRLCVVEDGAGYAVAHRRGRKLYLGPVGLDVRPGREYSTIRAREFVERYLTLATHHLATSGGGGGGGEGDDDDDYACDGIVVYVPEGLEEGSFATDSLGRQLRGTSALRCALKRRGFEAGERTTRMVMAPATRDECIGDWCSSDEGEEELEGFVTPLKTDANVKAAEVPGLGMGCLTVASLDLG